ncbi:hypothetical protein V1502_02200 [Bacillus sp. SCS-153A]|uniref:hypothetical protein n=1 Tax=Rossellomorea sedimentorum TaxID=3115294 RepID=UPI0039058BBA
MRKTGIEAAGLFVQEFFPGVKQSNEARGTSYRVEGPNETLHNARAVLHIV